MVVYIAQATLANKETDDARVLLRVLDKHPGWRELLLDWHLPAELLPDVDET